MPPHIIEPDRESDAKLNAFLDERIYETNIESTGFQDGRPFAGVIEDDSANIVAAVNGHTWGGSCYIAHLWVHASKRGQGLGAPCSNRPKPRPSVVAARRRSS